MVTTFFRLLFIILIPALVPSCVKSKSKSDNTESIKRYNLATPISYSVEDAACQATAQETSVSDQTVYLWEPNGSTSKNHSFDDMKSNEKITTDLIDGIYYDYKSRTSVNCTMGSDSKISCDENTTDETLSTEKLLKICKSSSAYKRDSIEGISLTSTFNLEEAAKFYKSLDDTVGALEKVLLLVMPVYEYSIKLVDQASGRAVLMSMAFTDNAAFASTEDSGQNYNIFIVFPKSEEMNKKSEWTDVNLWEIPWVMSHEYGHSLFKKHYSSYESDSADASIKLPSIPGTFKKDQVMRQKTSFDVPYLFDDNSHAATDSSLSSNKDKKRLSIPGELLGSEREINLYTSLGAISEAFADLFGFYQIGEPKDYIKQIPCFKNRDVLNSRFYDGSKKQLSQKIHDDYFKVEKNESDSSDDCNATSLQDSHDMGAIFAYAVNSLLEESATAVQNSTERSKVKAQKLLKWAEKLDDLRREQSDITPQDIFKLAVKSLLEVSSKEKTLTQKQCEIASDVFPTFEKELIDRSTSSEGSSSEMSKFKCAQL